MTLGTDGFLRKGMAFSEKGWYKRIEGCLRIPVGRTHQARHSQRTMLHGKPRGARGRKVSRGESDDDPESEPASVSERSMVWLFQISRLNFDRTVGFSTRPPELLASEPPNTIQETLQHRSIVNSRNASDAPRIPNVFASPLLYVIWRQRRDGSGGPFRLSFPARAQLTTLSSRDMMVTESKNRMHRRGATPRVGRRCERDGSRTRRPKDGVVGGTSGSVRPRQASERTFPPLSSF